MSLRGRALFDVYVASSLNHSSLKLLGIGTHVFNLSCDAAAAHIPVSEMTEEVGPLASALLAARKG